MTIAIDASKAVHPEPTGTELYSARLIEGLAQLDQENQYILYSPIPPSGSFKKLGDNFRWKIIPLNRLWTQLRLSWQLFWDKPDVLLVPAHVLPLYLPKRSVVTIHDLAYEVFPEAYSWFDRFYLKYAAWRAKNSADLIITPSQSTKTDLVRLYQIPAEKIAVVPLGYDTDRFKENITTPEEIKRLGLYFLSVGRLEKRKNSIRLIQAFERFKNEQPSSPAKLVLIGKPGFGYQDIERVLEQLSPKIRKSIIRPGYISNEEVTQYLAGAMAYVSPSLYEGFGLSVLEAMACGTPVITADSSSLPEVVDQAAILVNPESIDEITDALTQVATNQLVRRELKKKSLEQAKKFSWEKMSKTTHKLLVKTGKGE